VETLLINWRASKKLSLAGEQNAKAVLAENESALMLTAGQSETRQRLSNLFPQTVD
jgi:hypothetical protein